MSDLSKEELNNLKEIEKSHKEENEKLRVELEQEKEKNKELEIKLAVRDNIKVDKLVEKYRYYRKLANSYQANCISKDKIRKIIDENIPKQPNIITGEMEYAPNRNANSFLVQDILKLLEEN